MINNEGRLSAEVVVTAPRDHDNDHNRSNVVKDGNAAEYYKVGAQLWWII